MIVINIKTYYLKMIIYAIICFAYNISICTFLYYISSKIDKISHICLYYIEYNRNLQEDNNYLKK